MTEAAAARSWRALLGLPRQHSAPDLPPGVRNLIVLINDALGQRVTPAFADGAMPRQEAPAEVRRSGGTTQDDIPGSGAENGEGGDATDERVQLDDSHAEVWRLVERAQAGDGDAFGELYDRYVDTVYKFLYYRVNDRALAEDFTSETFLRALRRISSFSYQGRDIGAWFITIARNIVLDHVKSARYRLEHTTADQLETKEHAASTESAVLQTLQTEQLMAAVAQLGEEQRECVTLRFLRGLSVSETAAAMGKNDGAIKALQHRAVRKLADLVDGSLR